MADAEEGVGERGPVPADRLPRRPLTARQRRRTAAAGLTPIPLMVLVLAPFAILGPADAGDVVSAALVYGGLLGLAAGFVYVDRVQARQCPRCATPNARGAEVCDACGYDLEARPRYACDHRHRIYLEPGQCDCGRRLQLLPVVRGVNREVIATLKFGVWLLVLLIVVFVVLRVLEG